MSVQAKSPPLSAVLPYAWVILAVVYLASVAAPFNQFKAPPIMPLLLTSLNIDLAQAGVLMSSIALVGLLLALPAGVILQRMGLKLSGLIALICIGLGAAGGANASSFNQLLLSRVIEGIGIGLIGVIAPAAIAMWFPPDRQGAPMGLWATWVPVGTLAMYVFAPALAVAHGWRMVWWVGAGYALLAALIYVVFMRQPPALERDGPPDLHDQNIIKAISNRDIWLLALTFACFNLSLIGFATYYPTFLHEARAMPLSQAARVASVSSLVILFSAPAAGWLSDRIGSRRLVFSLPFLGIAVLFLFPFHLTGGWIILYMALQGLIAGAVPTAVFAAAPEVMPRPQWAGFGLAVILVGQNLGQLVGPVLFGGLAERLGWASAGYLMIPVCLLGFASGWMVKAR